MRSADWSGSRVDCSPSVLPGPTGPPILGTAGSCGSRRSRQVTPDRVGEGVTARAVVREHVHRGGGGREQDHVSGLGPGRRGGDDEIHRPSVRARHLLHGPGVAIRPSGTQVVSPVDGTVMLVFPTKHAIGVRSDTGVELLIHVGIDTVQLKGAGFETLVAKGDIVEVGTPLMRFDPAVIEAAGYPLTTPVIVTNAKKVGQPVVVAADTVREGHDLFTVP